MRPNTEVIKISIVAHRHTKYDDRPFSIFYESEHFGLKRLEINEKKNNFNPCNWKWTTICASEQSVHFECRLKKWLFSRLQVASFIIKFVPARFQPGRVSIFFCDFIIESWCEHQLFGHKCTNYHRSSLPNALRWEMTIIRRSINNYSHISFI